jgi:hypothetical protein
MFFMYIIVFIGNADTDTLANQMPIEVGQL